MKLQEFLRGGGSIADLEAKYAIKSRRHTKYNNLVLFKYNQIDSPMAEQICQEARGVILDETNNWNVVCRPFDKFFNYGEGHAPDIDWSTAKVMQKYDGSLCTIYHYNGEWHVSTTGTPDACGQVNDYGITFARLFWSVWAAKGYELPDGYEKYCFMFELMCPENRVVVRHGARTMVLLGVRHNESGEEVDLEDVVGLDFAYAKSYLLTSFDDCIKTFDSMDPLVQEGYVVVDKYFNRVKVKHPGYVAIHHIRGNQLTNKRIVEVIRAGEYAEIISYFPEWKDRFDTVAVKFNALIDSLTTAYESIKNIESQKEFAAHAVKTKVPDFLFRMRKGQVASGKDYFKDMRVEHLISVLGLKDDSNESVES